MIEIAKLLRSEGITHDAKRNVLKIPLTRRKLSIAEKRAAKGLPINTRLGGVLTEIKKTPHNPVGVVGQKNEQLLPQKCRSGTA